MRGLRALLLPLLLAGALAGCSSPDDDHRCKPVDTLARVDTIDGDTVTVQLLQSSQGHGPATLHTAGADFVYYAGSLDECYEAERGMLQPGQEIQFQAGAWMESYPPQARVDYIIIRG